MHILKKTNLVQGWLNKSERIGERRGKTLGIQIGERKGKLSLLERMLSQKFGKLPSKLVARLNSLNDRQLDNLSLVVLEAQSRKEVEAWMKNGLIESERIGERKGKVSLLTKMLSQKFGKLSSTLIAGPNSLDDKQLDNLSLVILQAQSRKEVEAWMKNGATRKRNDKH